MTSTYRKESISAPYKTTHSLHHRSASLPRHSQRNSPTFPHTMNGNNEAGQGTVSRATSVSRASKHGTSVSRAQSLIKKNVAPHDLRPSDVLIERFVGWKAIVKQLIAYFEVSETQMLGWSG